MSYLRTTFALMGLLVLPTVVAAESLESALRAIAAEEAAVFAKKKSHDGGTYTVGVLKWLIHKDRKNSASFGPLNQGLATRLETALLQTQTANESFQIRVVRKASSVADARPGMTHLTKKGRVRFFEDNNGPVKYPLYVGTETATPDVFLTGKAIFDPSYQYLEIQIYRFTRDEPEKLVRGPSRKVDIDLNILADSGESFSLRSSAKADGSGINFQFGEDVEPSTQAVKPTPEAVKEAVSTARETAVQPGQQSTRKDPAISTLPVKLEILYDGIVQEPFPQEVGGSRQLFVAEPQDNQEVSFRLTRVDNTSDVRYGVVLRVNGLNTVNQETAAAEDCRKWVLLRGAEPLPITGFVFTDKLKEVFPFKVSSQAESIQKEIDCGDQSGQISMTIYREGPPQVNESALDLDELEKKQNVVVRRGVQVREGATEDEVVAALDPEGATRGIIDLDSTSRPGQARITRPFNSLEFVDTVTITYRPRLAP